jgi:hypothetical protein
MPNLLFTMLILEIDHVVLNQLSDLRINILTYRITILT